jgi:hypothetical protein
VRDILERLSDTLGVTSDSCIKVVKTPLHAHPSRFMARVVNDDTGQVSRIESNQVLNSTHITNKLTREVIFPPRDRLTLK